MSEGVLSMYIVGIDIAKRFHEAAIIDRLGNVIVKRIRFANSHGGFLKLMDAVRKLNAPVEFGMEATGHYWLPLYAHLRQAGQSVHVINPLQSDALRSMFIRKTKNDTIDALIVAEIIRFGRYCETQVAPENIQALREFCRQRFFIVDTASDFKRKIIALLDQTFPKYEKSDGRMSKRGSPYLRRAVWLAATVAAFKDPAVSLFYQKKRAEEKDHLTAIGHVCHKMLAIIFAVLRDNKPYVPASAS